ncbi:MAG: Crp/Fnr family transcriptional regulator [bacterium]
MNGTDCDANCKVWYLKRFNIFDKFSKKELESLTDLLHLNEFDKRNLIVFPGDNGNKIHFLVKGRAKLSRLSDDGNEFILEILRPGEIFGPLAVPQEHSTNAQVVALERCLVGHIHHSDFNQLMEKKPDLCFEVIKVMGERLVRIENRLEELLFRDVPCRLARLLLRLSEEYPHELDCGVRIDVTLTQQELANLIGATREMTSITLNRFKRNGWIETHERCICLHDLKNLKKLAK